jgi:hypothetical protein
MVDIQPMVNNVDCSRYETREVRDGGRGRARGCVQRPPVFSSNPVNLIYLKLDISQHRGSRFLHWCSQESRPLLKAPLRALGNDHDPPFTSRTETVSTPLAILRASNAGCPSRSTRACRRWQGRGGYSTSSSAYAKSAGRPPVCTNTTRESDPSRPVAEGNEAGTEGPRFAS